FSLALEPCQILGLIGPNAASKTTVSNLIPGFSRPTSGQIFPEGRSIAGLRPHAVIRRGIARTFQLVKPFPRLSVRENVTLAAFTHEQDHPGVLRVQGAPHRGDPHRVHPRGRDGSVSRYELRPS